MSREREIALYREWDQQLNVFFLRMESSSLSTEQEFEEQPSQTSLYRRRVEQDLNAFEQKLSKIMEREQRGQ